MTARPGTSLLVANRGEIALRVFRTAERMGLRTVAVHSDADADAPFVRAADHAVRIGPAPAAESYLRYDRIVEAARGTGATLVHPGYGFGAEDPALARACEDAGLTFVGPPSGVLAEMGDKGRAKRLAREAGTPVLEGYAEEAPDDAALAEAAADVGFPVLVKPAAGGGGKGMAIVRRPGELEAAVASARRVAEAAFGDGRLVLERYLEHPHHVEVQVVADAHGSVIHLGERDCSLQRRHQKILEESPSPAVDETLRARLCEGAVALARRAGYVNAGTCEFLVGADGAVGFIEMNARLQVEHPVTELVCGLDLVELQLRVALGEELPIRQRDVTSTGHAFEARIYAEDPDAGFLPQAGRVLHVAWPEGVRVDAGVQEGTDVPPHYDPLIAKVVVHDSDRDAALDRLREALGACEILGPRTNLPFLLAATADPVVRRGEITTTWLEGADISSHAGDDPRALAVAAAAEAAHVLGDRRDPDPWTALGPWRAGREGTVRVVLRSPGERVVEVAGRGPFRVEGSTVERGASHHRWLVDGTTAAAVRDDGRWLVWLAGRPHEVGVGPAPRRIEGDEVAHLGAPMPGQVIAVRVAPGDEVAQGQDLVVVEAMKMEHAVRAPAAGKVTAVLCAEGDQVERDQPLVDVEPSGGAEPGRSASASSS